MIRDARQSKSAAELTRKEIKGPDHFQVAASNFAEWAGKNRSALLGGVAGALVLLVAAVGVRAWMQAGRDAAGGKLYRALEAADGMVSTVPLPGVQQETFKTEEERQQAVVERADRVRREHAGTPAARSAALASGGASLRLKQWDAARAAFDEYLASAPADDLLRFAGLDGLARAQEGKGDLDAAAQTFERAGREAAFYKDRADLERARILVRTGKADEARKLLQAFPDENKDSALKAEAQERLARLGGK